MSKPFAILLSLSLMPLAICRLRGGLAVESQHFLQAAWGGLAFIAAQAA